MITLTVYSHYEPHVSQHETVQDAAETALGVLEFDAAFPDSIVEDEKTIWKFTRLDDMREELARIAGIKDSESED